MHLFWFIECEYCVDKPRHPYVIIVLTNPSTHYVIDKPRHPYVIMWKWKIDTNAFINAWLCRGNKACQPNIYIWKIKKSVFAE